MRGNRWVVQPIAGVDIKDSLSPTRRMTGGKSQKHSHGAGKVEVAWLACSSSNYRNLSLTEVSFMRSDSDPPVKSASGLHDIYCDTDTAHSHRRDFRLDCPRLRRSGFLLLFKTANYLSSQWRSSDSLRALLKFRFMLAASSL